MDYEKAYKESFEAAKGLHDAGNALTKKQMEIVFPQLAESEDERIRKELVAFFIEVRNREGNEGYWHDLKVADILTYLEKQKEQKPAEINLKALLTADRLASAEMTGRLKERSEILENPEKYGLQKAAEWSEDDRQWLESIIREYEERLSVDKDHAAVIQIKIDFLKSLSPQPKQEWSEEDKNALTYLHELIGFGYSEKFMDAQTSAGMREWVNKSLRHSWKPTEEQISAFNGYIEDFQARAEAAVGGWNNFDVMIRLYEQLKRLRG